MAGGTRNPCVVRPENDKDKNAGSRESRAAYEIKRSWYQGVSL
jgi:hypothetical protein